MRTSDFDFYLPDELIAQEPPNPRGSSRLLVLDRSTGEVQDRNFTDLPEFLNPQDLLVLNTTRVFPARLLGQRDPTGGGVECLLIRELPTPDRQRPTSNSQLPSGDTEAAEAVEASSSDMTEGASSCSPAATDGGLEGGRSGDVRPISPDAANETLGVGSWEVGSSLWEALVHPGHKLKPGARMVFESAGRRLHGEVLSRHFHGRRIVRLWTDDGSPVTDAVEGLGHMPLPPYIRRGDRQSDRERYQTVFARERGSIAAPTAGLHFTTELLTRLDQRGVERAHITLHVGYGTFKPVRTDAVEEHTVDPERFTVGEEAADQLTRAHREGRRIVAVGTTTTRALESLAIADDGRICPAAGETQLFIRPGSEFRIVQGLVTNFHLPRSSLLMLVAAFAGRERVLAAYRHAVAERYRFYSYGDAMLIV